MGSDVEVTEADREKAREVILAGDGGPESWTQVLAQALADERAKARAPFLAVIPEIQAIADDLGWAVGAHYAEVADRIRRAAEDPPEVSET